MKKPERKKLFSKEGILTLVIIFVMTSSVIGFMWGKDSSNTMKYKDFTFLRANSQWVLKTKTFDFAFDYFPSEIESILIPNEAAQKIKGTVEIDITYDFNSTYSESIASVQYSMEQNLKAFDIYIRKGFTSNNTYSMPIITCNDSTEIVPVIYFKESNETKVFIENNCIIAEGSSEIDFIKIKDRLLYSFLGIIG